MTYNINLDLRNGEHYAFSCYNAKERNLELQNILSEYDDSDIVYLDYDKEYASGDRHLGKVLVDNTKTFSKILEENSVKPVNKDDEKEVKEKRYIDTDDILSKTEYIHESYLNDLLMDIWKEIYNHKPFSEYDEDFLCNCYLELYKLERENRWILEGYMSEKLIDYSLLVRASNEHYLLIKIVGIVLAYIEAPFNFIDSLYFDEWSKEEMKYFGERWG